mgnify:CR=1 FL=1
MKKFKLLGNENFGRAWINNNSIIKNKSCSSGYIYAHGQLDNSKLIGDTFFYNNITGNHFITGPIRNERTQYNAEPIALDPEEYKYTDGDGNYNATNPPPEDTEVSPPLGDVLY